MPDEYIFPNDLSIKNVFVTRVIYYLILICEVVKIKLHYENLVLEI